MLELFVFATALEEISDHSLGTYLLWGNDGLHLNIAKEEVVILTTQPESGKGNIEVDYSGGHKVLAHGDSYKFTNTELTITYKGNAANLITLYYNTNPYEDTAFMAGIHVNPFTLALQPNMHVCVISSLASSANLEAESLTNENLSVILDGFRHFNLHSGEKLTALNAICSKDVFEEFTISVKGGRSPMSFANGLKAVLECEEDNCTKMDIEGISIIEDDVPVLESSLLVAVSCLIIVTGALIILWPRKPNNNEYVINYWVKNICNDAYLENPLISAK